MPLPDNGVPWPPPAQRPILDRLGIWSAWYSGDPDVLGAVYGGATASGSLPAQQFSASEAGGFKARVKGAWSRFWWGQPLPPGEKNTKLHIPLAADISSVSADLLFGEPPTFTVDDADTQSRLDELVDEGDLVPTLREGAEIGSALGGIFYRICWDSDFADHPWISAVHPDAAVPEWRYGRLYAVTFWKVIRQSDDGKEVIRHLERHEPKQILHAVYVGDSEKLGIRHPLTDFEETAYLAEGLTDGDVMPTGVDDLTACYVPNVKPNRCWRDLPQAHPLGRSDYQGVEPQMDALDEAWSSWMRDLRLGKARIIAAKQMIESYGRGQGGRVDLDRELWTGVDMLGRPGEAPLQEIQFQIRVAEHAQTTQTLTEGIIRSTGYSLQSFGMQGEGATMQTATEVSARQGRSASTRGRKIGYTASPLAGLLETLLAIDREFFNSGVTPERPHIEFPDGASPDPLQVSQTVQALRTAKAASTRTLVQMVHPDWDKDQVDEEVARIEGEEPKPVQLQSPPDGGASNGDQASEAVRQQGPVAPVRREPTAEEVLPPQGRSNNGNGRARNTPGQGRVPRPAAP